MPHTHDDLIIHILANILKRDPDDIRADQGPYAAYHWDDGFLEDEGERIDWEAGSFESQTEAHYPFWARCDFDGPGTIIEDNFAAAAPADGALASFIAKSGGHLVLPQVAELLRRGHVEVEYPMVYGRIKGGSALVEDVWEEMLAGVEDETLYAHLGAFFQDLESARSFGAYFEGPKGDGEWEGFGLETVACWSIGEGQGHLCLARIDDAPALAVPDLGHL